MVLRIEKVSKGKLLILRLSGRLQAEQLAELKAHLDPKPANVVLDLEGVKLVDRDVVCFLAVCEAKGVHLRQCSPYIREWISREKASRASNR
jgi:hypothetical protein